MNIEGTYTLQASPESIWQSLMDVQVLQRAIPGVERLAKVGEDTYEIALQIKQTPFVGNLINTWFAHTVSTRCNKIRSRLRLGEACAEEW